jgi:hypothetical protein
MRITSRRSARMQLRIISLQRNVAANSLRVRWNGMRLRRNVLNLSRRRARLSHRVSLSLRATLLRVPQNSHGRNRAKRRRVRHNLLAHLLSVRHPSLEKRSRLIKRAA